MQVLRETQHLSSIQLFRQQPTKVFACPWKFSWAQLLNNHFLALIVAARNKYLCNFWYLHFCIFSPCTISCWHEHCHLQKYVELLTIDPSFPVFLLHSRPKQPIFLEQAPAWIVRWGWMARETARLENLPQTSGNFRLARWEDGKTAGHSFCSKCCHMASKRGLKGPSNKTAWWLGASLSMCLVTLKKGTTRAFFAASIYHE